MSHNNKPVSDNKSAMQEKRTGSARADELFKVLDIFLLFFMLLLLVDLVFFACLNIVAEVASV